MAPQKTVVTTYTRENVERVAKSLKWTNNLIELVEESTPEVKDKSHKARGQLYGRRSMQILYGRNGYRSDLEGQMEHYFKMYGPGAHLRNDFYTEAKSRDGSEFGLAKTLWRGDSEFEMPMCRICTENETDLPEGDRIPTGIEDNETLGCGCIYGEVIFEERKIYNINKKSPDSWPPHKPFFASKEERAAAVGVLFPKIGEWVFGDMIKYENASNGTQ